MIIGAVIQARLGSTRLPRKVVMDICGKPALQRVIERVQKIKGLHKIIVAFPAKDREIGDVALQSGALVYPSLGDTNDVLSRYYGAAKAYDLDGIMRVTADCPLLDPEVSGRVLETYMNSKYDYVSNTIPATFPNGLDTEIFTYWALLMAHKGTVDPYHREHVTSWMYTLPRPVRCFNVFNSQDDSKYRLTLDTSEDLVQIRNIYSKIGTDDFGWEDIKDLYYRYPSMVYTESFDNIPDFSI